MKLSNTFGKTAVFNIPANHLTSSYLFSFSWHGDLHGRSWISQLYSIRIGRHSHQLIIILLVFHFNWLLALDLPHRAFLCGQCHWSELLHWWHYQCGRSVLRIWYSQRSKHHFFVIWQQTIFFYFRAQDKNGSQYLVSAQSYWYLAVLFSFFLDQVSHFYADFLLVFILYIFQLKYNHGLWYRGLLFHNRSVNHNRRQSFSLCLTCQKMKLKNCH